MIDYLTQQPSYVVLVCTLIIWLGISLYLKRIDTKIRQIEEQRKGSL